MAKEANNTTPRIEFVQRRESFGDDGSPRAQYWFVFRVNGKLNVNVFVHFGAIDTLRGGRLSEDEAKLAAQTLIEMEIDSHRDLEDVGSGLVLDQGAMFHISARLGWRERFYASVSRL